LQAQGAKGIVTQLAGQVPGQLVSVLGGAIAHKLAVKVGVGVHAVQGLGPFIEAPDCSFRLYQIKQSFSLGYMWKSHKALENPFHSMA
jgi:hypothetical protein